MKCGNCRWFDGSYLNKDGDGSGECCLEPPVWVGPSPTAVDANTWTEYTNLYGWERPMVHVGETPCRHYAEPHKKRWWEE